MNAEAQPLVSVITPVYNTEKYLAECIESVLAQSYQNWEYVIVNNCSTDRSLEIARQYAAQDPRIRIHDNQEFLGALQNWNHAMRQISPESKYCKVVHADDWLFPECLAQMVALAEANPSVGIVGSYRLDETEVNLDGLPYPSTVVPGRELCRWSFLKSAYIFGSPSSLLLRSDLVRGRDPFYNESNRHADKEICYDLLQQTDFGFVHQVLTFTRRHNEAATMLTRKFSTFKLSTLYILLKYGPIYLSDQEFKQKLARRLDRYYHFLAKSAFEMREKEFWEYHKSELEELGLPLSRLRLFKAMLFLGLFPVNTIGLIKRGLRRRSGVEPADTPGESTLFTVSST